MGKAVQILSNLNENFFDCEPLVRFDFAVKKFCGSRIVLAAGLVDCRPGQEARSLDWALSGMFCNPISPG
jgi:hypothetical protein